MLSTGDLMECTVNYKKESYFEEVCLMDVLGKGFTKPTARIQALRDAIYDATPTVEADRAELVTASYKETEGLPIILRRAKAVEKILTEIPIAIRDHELIAGSLTVSIHGCQIYPEYSFDWVEKEFDTMATRMADPFEIPKDTAKRLHDAFLYWPGNAVADEWITSYTGMFLTLAQEKGYAVHPNVLNKWKRFQRAAAQNWRMPQEASNWQIWQSELQQAFRLYTLALAGAPEYGAMNRMKEQPGLSIQAKWRLAAAYALTGKMKPAGELVYNAETTVIPYSSMNLIYGSSDRDEAMILETLILMKRDRDALQQAKKVSQNLAQENWFSTQSTAFALMAMGRLAEQLSGTLDFTWSWNGKQQPAVKSAKAVFEKEIATSPKSGTVSVKNQGKGALSVDLITRTQLLNDTLPAIADNIRLDVKYTDMAGSPISVEDIRQGTDFMSAVTLSNCSGTSDYSNLALTHIIPSGWEIYNERMIVPEASSSNSNEANTPESSADKYTYKDIRDDRVLTYFDLRRGESKTFTVRLQATYAGNFILPAIQCEAMYDAAVQARTKAGRTTVSR